MSPREPQLLDTMAPLDGAERARLRFEPEGAEVRVPSGTPVFDAASWNGIAIDSTCGGHGTCKKCKVRVLEGDVPVSVRRPARVQRRRAARRLAARVPRAGARRARDRGAAAADAAEGGARRRRPPRDPAPVDPEAPPRARTSRRWRTSARTSSACRTRSRTSSRAPGSPVLRTLGRVLRSANWDVTAVVADEELIDVEPGDTTARRFAIAFDLGTTTVVATLLDLETGTPAAVQSMLNRQQPFGADVITRISATMMDDAALDSLQARAQETMAQLTEEVCAEARVDPGEVYEITLCGNVTMTQLALGIDPEPLSMAPFVVTTHDPPPLDRRRLRRAGAPARAGVRVPVARRLRRRRHRRGHARHRADARQAAAAVHRRRHELGDRARQPGRASSRPPRPPARRSRPRRSAAGCAPPTARSRA